MKIQHFYVGWRFERTLWYCVHSNVLIVSKIIPLSGTLSNSPTYTAPNARLFALSTPYCFLSHKLSGPMWVVMLRLLSMALVSLWDWSCVQCHSWSLTPVCPGFQCCTSIFQQLKEGHRVGDKLKAPLAEEAMSSRTGEIVIGYQRDKMWSTKRISWYDLFKYKFTYI